MPCARRNAMDTLQSLKKSPPFGIGVAKSRSDLFQRRRVDAFRNVAIRIQGWD
jgi:hypothetical protein